jgi:methyltransferase (TIGR00027 family)
VVAIDLRQDWPAALLRAGFDADQRTAWIAEGLFGYLPPDAQDQLVDHITALSAKGSRLALESIPDMHQLDEDSVRQRIPALTEAWRNYGFDLDFTELVYLGDRNDAEKYLNTHGWETVGTATSDLFVANGLDPVQDDSDQDAPANVAYVSATLT